MSTPTPTPGAHCRLGASKAHRWLNCPGSVEMSEGIPDEPSPYAEEGTLAHEVAAWCLLSGRGPDEYAAAHKLDEPLPDDMLPAVALYLEVCKSVPYKQRLVEQRITLDKLHPPEPMWGTSDYASWDGGEVLTVIDYKHGAGVIVQIEGNDQTRFYALGAYLHFGEQFPDFQGKVRTVEMMIVQPRTPNPVRKTRIPIEDLLLWAAELIDGAQRTQEDDAPLNAGDWCRWCPAAAGCPALAKRASSLAQIEFGEAPTTPDAGALSRDELLQVMEWAPAIRAWLESVHKRVYSMALSANAPGWKVVRKAGNRRWIDEEATKEALQKTFGLAESDYKVDKLKSPAQIEKLVGKRKKELAPLYEKPEGGQVLVRESDKRPAITAMDDAIALLANE